jgi:hypothetical protein
MKNCSHLVKNCEMEGRGGKKSGKTSGIIYGCLFTTFCSLRYVLMVGLLAFESLELLLLNCENSPHMFSSMPF